MNLTFRNFKNWRIGKMQTASIPKEHRQAMERIAEINDLFGEIHGWAGNAADTEIKALYHAWQTLLSKEVARSKIFVDQCLKLIDRCLSFRAEVVEKKGIFVKNAQDKISAIQQYADGNGELLSLLKDVLDMWNAYGQPRLEMLFDRSFDLETSIRDVIDLVLEPMDKKQENPL